ncbi:MAG: hypothetical protein ACT4PU_05105 [Planctomycetota bacterium]
MTKLPFGGDLPVLAGATEPVRRRQHLLEKSVAASWECSECTEENDLDPDAEEGQILECSECGTEFEIVRTEPLALQPLAVGGDDDDDLDE